MSHISRHLEVIYCDDIREEVNHKFSYIGVYSGELIVQTAPVLLPKLCIGVKVVTDMDDPFETLEVRVVKVKGEDETELLSTGTTSPPTELPRPDGSALIVAQMHFTLIPFHIDEETSLRVKAITEREELRGIGLRIRIVPPPAPPTVQ
ncbi:MAG: hypothetical protein M1283_06065 [Gammaproteobacteria bacterium]|nr:hypothetical protein [Gammaproteobacteria bacterium]